MKSTSAKSFAEVTGYTFKNINLMELAFTHSSFANENKMSKTQNNERLEFLGDAVLELVISEYIYNVFDQLPEGELTKLRAGIVCEPMLAKKSRALNFGDYLIVGKGEEAGNGRTRDSILADTFEAVIGAIFLDSGIDMAREFIMKSMESEIFGMKDKYKQIDCKTALQELIQKNSDAPIEYVVINECGPDHNKYFESQVSHNGRVLGEGAGKSKKEAEQNAAFEALKVLKK